MAALDLVAQAALWRLIGAVLQSLPLTALVWLLCRFVHRLGPSARCWLWWLVSLQLLAGLVWPAPVRLPLLPAPDVAPTSLSIDAPQVQLRTALTVQADGRIAVHTDAATAVPGTHAGDEANGASQAWLRLFALAYLAGVAAMATRSLLDLRTTRRRLRACSEEVPAAVLARYQLLAARLGVRQVPPLRLCAQLDSPQLCGVLRPRLLLPATQLPRMSADAIDMALHHELVHLRRGDLLWGWVPVMAQHLFFFHPLAHLAAREYGLAREAACDAAVLADDRHAPQDYGRLLLQFGVAPRALAVVGAASPNFILLKRRLTMLQSRTTPWRAGAFALIAAVATLGVLPYRVVAAAPDSDPAKRANLAAAEPAVVAQPATKAAPAAKVQPAAHAKHAAMAQPAATPHAVAAVSANKDWMPPPPPPPVPPVPAVPAVPVPAIAPPPPPEPPVPEGAMRGTFSLYDKGDTRNAWVLMEGDHVHAFGTPNDLRDARSQQHGEEALWWFRDGSKRYVVRDAATLAKLKQAYAPLQALGSQQSDLGEEQGELGRQQGTLGARQGDLGARQAEISARVAQLAAEQSTAALSGKPLSQQRQQQAEREQQALAREMDALAAQQVSLGTRQGALGRRQSELGKRQEAALEQLRAQGERLAREAVASGKAQVL